MYLLDTNVIAEMRKVTSGKADMRFAKWAKSVDANRLYVSTITLMELELGVSLKERKDKKQGAALRLWLDKQVLPEFAQRTIVFDTAVAIHCARLHVPDKRSERDAMIAASAIVHGMAVVTRNTADFKATGVRLLNPWQAQK
jgi:toxin FitB